MQAGSDVPRAVMPGRWEEDGPRVLSSLMLAWLCQIAFQPSCGVGIAEGCLLPSLRGPPISEPPIASAVTRESAACEEQPAFRPQLPRAPSWRWSARSAVWLPVPHQQPLVSAAETGESGWFWGAEHNLQTAPRQQPSRWPKTPCAQQRHSAKQSFAHGCHGVGPSAEIRRGEAACAAGHQCMP